MDPLPIVRVEWRSITWVPPDPISNHVAQSDGFAPDLASGQADVAFLWPVYDSAAAPAKQGLPSRDSNATEQVHDGDADCKCHATGRR